MSLAWILLLSCIFTAPTVVRAAGWLDYAKDLTLGTAVSGSIKSGDFYIGDYYWHIYKFTMPYSGLLHMYIESKSGDYDYAELRIYPVSDVENLLWSYRIDLYHSSASAIYYDWTEFALDQGEYYVVLIYDSGGVFKPNTVDTPYYLTLYYKEPVINIASLTLDRTKLTLQPGEQYYINASIQPQNATDKTIVWRTSNPAAATVQNGLVTAVSAGYATITAASLDGDVSAVCQVTVTQPAAVQEIQNSKTSVKKLSAGKKKAKIRFSPIKISGIAYQISYKTGKGKWKTKSTKKTSYTISKLSSKKKYSVRVRGYKKINGKTYYGRWSAVRTVTIK